VSQKTPILVGIAQVLQRDEDLDVARTPLELMLAATREAAVDAGSRELLTRATSVRVIRGMWSYGDPGRAIAEEIGCPTAQTAITSYGGNFVQTTLNQSFLDIQAGHQDVVLVTGGECGRSYALGKKQGRKLRWRGAPGTPDLQIGRDLPMSHDAEVARGLRAPIQMYPIFENALRAARGETIEAQRERLGKLWAGFSEVASRNPHAWIRERKSAREITSAGPGNPPVSFPYPMLMNSNSRVDMAAALIATSEETARALGIGEEKWVYPHAGSDAHDIVMVSERVDLHRSPAIRMAAGRCLEMAGVEVGDLSYRDVYSCFPSAVQVAAREIGLDESQPLTVTGGLTFGGGPMNSYVMHGVARMAERLREDPGSKGLCTANGGFLTKHAFGVYSTAPPERPFRHADLQSEVDELPSREARVDAEGNATIESYTIMYRDGDPADGYLACLLPDGTRTWAHVDDKDLCEAMTQDEFCGRPAHLPGDGSLRVSA